MLRKPPEVGVIQSANKALILLKLVGIHHAEGLRLTDFIALTGFDKSTVHRLLTALIDEGFVERIPSTKLYRLGVESMQLGFASANMAPLVDRFRPHMLKIARICGDTVFLVVRSGDSAVYVHRQEGSYPVKVFAADPGKRKLLGVSAVGVCILAQETDEEIAAIYERNKAAYQQIGMNIAALRDLVKFVRKHGYSEMSEYGPPDTAGVGYAFQISATTQIGVSIAAIDSRMSKERRRELGNMLRQEFAQFQVRGVPLPDIA